MARKGVLGKGLNALLPSEEPSQEDSDSTAESEASRSKLYRFENRTSSVRRLDDIAVDQIRPNPHQPRRDFDEDALDELAASIEQFGIIQPITVRAIDDTTFEIISGERRLRAARRAALPHVPAYIRTADPEEMLEMALVENVQREDLNPVEVALGYQQLIDECGLTHEEVAEKVGKNRSTVTNVLRLLRLPPRIQAYLRDGTVTTGHARVLVTLDDEELQLKLAETVRTKGLTVRATEKLVRAYKEEKEKNEQQEDASSPSEESTPDRVALEVQDVTNKLRTRFSTQVRIQHKNNGAGKIEISYYDPEDLERLLELMLNA